MAGATVRITADVAPLEEALAGLVRQARDLQPVFSDIGEYLLIRHRERWQQEVSPDGTPWQPLSEDYRRRKRRNKDKILVLDDHLRGLLRYHSSADELQFGTDRIYGATHQFGSADGDVPARPFLGIDEADRQEIGRLIGEHLMAG